MLVRDDLGGVAVSDPGPPIAATAEVDGGWLFELADGSFARSESALGPLAPFAVDVPTDSARPPTRYDWPHEHRGALAVVREGRVFEIDLAGAREIDTPWPAKDVVALGGDQRLVVLLGGGLMRGAWDALQSVPLAGPVRGARTHLGRMAVLSGGRWVEVDGADLAPRPSRCLLRAAPREARDSVLRELLARDLVADAPTPFFDRHRTRADGAESWVLGDTLFRRAPDGAISSVPIEADRCRPHASDDAGWWLACERALVRVGDDGSVSYVRGREPLPRVAGWWGSCERGPRVGRNSEGALVCVAGANGATHEIRMHGEAIARCGDTLYSSTDEKLFARSLTDGRVREVAGRALGRATCLPDGALAMLDEGLRIWRDGVEPRELPFDALGIDASGRGELVVTHGPYVASSVDEGRTWRVVELAPDEALRCGKRCEAVAARRRLLDELPTSDGVRYLHTEPYRGREVRERRPEEPTLRCTHSPIEPRLRVEGDRLEVRHDDGFRAVPLERDDPHVLLLGDDDLVVDDGGVLARATFGWRTRRTTLEHPPGPGWDACRRCGMWVGARFVAHDRAGRLVVLSSICDTELTRYHDDGTVQATRHLFAGSTLAFDASEAFAVFELAAENPDSRRVVAYPLDPTQPTRLWTAPRAHRICRDGERGDWTWHSHDGLEGDGVRASTVLEITADDACVSELRNGPSRLVASGGRLVGAVRSGDAWVQASCEVVESASPARR